MNGDTPSPWPVALSPKTTPPPASSGSVHGYGGDIVSWHSYPASYRLLVARLLSGHTGWVARIEETRHLRVGYFGASTGGGAALVAAARLEQAVGAVVSRGGRPDLAGAALPRVVSPTLLIVGGHDAVVIQLNEAAYAQLQCKKALKIVPGATHLFEEPGALEDVAQLATEWFRQYLYPCSHLGAIATSALRGLSTEGEDDALSRSN